MQTLLNKYVYTDKLDFDACVFNLVAMAGALALGVATIGHFVVGAHIYLLIIKTVMCAACLAVFYISNKFHIHHHARWISVIGFCDILFPITFFFNGGSHGGMTAYFALTISFIALLSKGMAFWIFLFTHLCVIFACYAVELSPYADLFIIPYPGINDGEFGVRFYTDNIIAVVDTGVFWGLMLVGISKLYDRERAKADIASKAKSVFLANMSHEMRTPLNAVIGMVQIAQRSPDKENINQCIQQIYVSSKHLLQLINDILDISKIEDGKFYISHVPFELKKTIESIRLSMNPIAVNKNLEFLIAYNFVAEHLPLTLLGDDMRLSQVIINLLSNAFKFTPENGTVCLDITELPPPSPQMVHLRFAVTDTGIGINPALKSRIFKPFEQADNGIVRNYGGTGLGLAICRRIVQLLGSEIQLESEPGSGACFHFSLAFERAEMPAPEMETGSAANVRESSLITDYSAYTILTADDVAINQMILKQCLKECAVHVEEAANGEEAVHKFLNSPAGYYSLIFMDMQMPVMDGCTAVRAIRSSAHPDAKKVPIVAMTANAFQEDVQMVLDAGMNGHISKPIDFQKVQETVRQYIALQKSKK